MGRNTWVDENSGGFRLHDKKQKLLVGCQKSCAYQNSAHAQVKKENVFCRRETNLEDVCKH
jgi:hypothetical protein